MAKAKLGNTLNGRDFGCSSDIEVLDRRLMFRCPGCEDVHAVPIEGPRAWGWNESLDSPTLTPSILTKSRWPIVEGKMIHPFKYKGEYPCENGEHVCHSFVTQGRIEFLGDCTHALAGQTMELPDWKESAYVEGEEP